ncbi:hypothetical protein DFH27DRAFT_643820 [Peziza echinospora]|nr:hypothetical protein DFH27DRAFT_643820 [Peziza echinospora]
MSGLSKLISDFNDEILQKMEALRSGVANLENQMNGPNAWMSRLKPYQRHHEINSIRLEGTGQWLLDNADFKSWKDTPSPSSKVLWLPGDPGVGKTVLASNFIEKLANMAKTSDEKSPLAYIYCNYRDQTSGGQTYENIAGCRLN